MVSVKENKFEKREEGGKERGREMEQMKFRNMVRTRTNNVIE